MSENDYNKSYYSHQKNDITHWVGATPGSGGSSGASGSQYHVREVYSLIIEAVKQLKKDQKTHSPDEVMHCMFLLYLFMELGAQKTGKAGENVSKMNSLMDHFHQAMKDFYESDNPAMSGAKGKALWVDFRNQLQDIKNAVIRKPSWFQDTSQGRQIAASITSAVTGLSATAESATSPSDSNPLYNLWQKYDPSGGSGASSGSTGDMNPFMQQLGQLNQQLTSTSQIMSAEAKTTAKTWQSEMDSYNNFSKALNNLVKFMTQQQQPR